MPRVWPVVRWVLLVIGLVALNLAGAAFPPAFNVYERTWSNSSPRPPRGFGIRFVGDFSPNPSLTARPIEPPPGTRLELDYCDLFEGLPRVLNLSVDGTLVQRSPMEVALPRRTGCQRLSSRMIRSARPRSNSERTAASSGMWADRGR